MSNFTRINHQGNAKMADVSNKSIIRRIAKAHSSITVNEVIYHQIIDNTNKKGSVLDTAQIAGIMTAKSTSTIIPMYRPLPLTGIDIEFSWNQANTQRHYQLSITITISTTGKTGVEVEALTAAPVTALTVYDMTKAADKGMIIGNTYLKSKSGGKSGDHHRQLD